MTTTNTTVDDKSTNKIYDKDGNLIMQAGNIDENNPYGRFYHYHY